MPDNSLTNKILNSKMAEEFGKKVFEYIPAALEWGVNEYNTYIEEKEQEKQQKINFIKLLEEQNSILT